MELLHMGVGAAELLGRDPVVVRHRDAVLARVLRRGEEVVVADRDGEYHAATVLTVSEDSDPVYQLRIGARLPLEMVAQRLADDREEIEDADIHEVVDLLGELRRMIRPPADAEGNDEGDVSGPGRPEPR